MKVIDQQNVNNNFGFNHRRSDVDMIFVCSLCKKQVSKIIEIDLLIHICKDCAKKANDLLGE